MSEEAKEYLKQSLETLLYEIVNAQLREEYESLESYSNELAELQKKAKQLYQDNPFIKELQDNQILGNFDYTIGSGQGIHSLASF